MGEEKVFDFNIDEELDKMNKEKKSLEMALDNRRNEIASMLMSDMGKDIDDVLSGKKKVKLSFFEKVKYSFRFYIDKLFKLF